LTLDKKSIIPITEVNVLTGKNINFQLRLFRVAETTIKLHNTAKQPTAEISYFYLYPCHCRSNAICLGTISIVMPNYPVANNMPNFKVESCPAISQMLTTSNPERKASLCQINWFS
jgi:hypothetical protein